MLVSLNSMFAVLNKLGQITFNNVYKNKHFFNKNNFLGTPSLRFVSNYLVISRIILFRVLRPNHETQLDGGDLVGYYISFPYISSLK